MSLYGIRLFYSDYNKIVSPVKRIPWTSDINKSVCFSNEFYVFEKPVHKSPNIDCGCGFYANWTLKHLLECANEEGSFAVYSRLPFALGLVEAYGEVVLCEKGFRAEYMRIVGFLPLSSHIEIITESTNETLFGFPISIRTARFELKDDLIYGTFCSGLIGVQCLDINAANYLLNMSFLENA